MPLTTAIPSAAWRRSPASRGLQALLAAAAALHGASAVAQAPPVSPGAVQQQQQQEQERRAQEERLRRSLPATELSIPRAADTGAVAMGAVAVTRFEVDDSAILSAAEIGAVLQPLQGRSVSFAELQGAVAALNRLYDNKGYASARAILPPQTVQGGVVRIRLVEARVGEVRVHGSEGAPAPDAAQVAFVLARMGLRSGEILNTAALEAALLRFNRLQDGRVQASVVAGSRFGTTDIEINLVEAPGARFSGFADNAGRDTVGAVRGGINARLVQVLRAGDSLQFSTTHSTGSTNFALSYATPLTADDLKLELSASRGDIQVISGPFQPLDIEGRSRDFTLGLNYPLKVNAEGQWSLYGRVSARDSLSTIGGAEQGTVGFGLFTLGSLKEVQGSGSAWYMDNSLTVGAPRNSDQGDSFVYYRGNLTRFDRLGPRTQLLLRGSVQLSNSDLVPSSESFQVGGAQSVRGYSSGLLSGRNGYLASAEVRFGLGAEAAGKRAPETPAVQGLVFLDHGGAVPLRGGSQKAVTRHDFITSVGLGLQVDKGTGFSARAVLAHPLTRNPAEARDKALWWHLSLNLALN